jgi:hypothetical protein
MKHVRTLLTTIIIVGLLVAGSPALAQTPDGETPFNEGICDSLIGGTPGLYGLCVGFCESQDCEATIDADGNLSMGANCKTASRKLLTNYNKKAQAGDPPMPCINVEVDECPCWTPEELASANDLGSFITNCGTTSTKDGGTGAAISFEYYTDYCSGNGGSGTFVKSYGVTENAGEIRCSAYDTCTKGGTYLDISAEEYVGCKYEVLDTCNP